VSQKIVFDILNKLGGHATISEINEVARQEYSDRSVASYTNKRLKSLEKKGVVDNTNDNSEIVWSIADDDNQKSATRLDQLCNGVTKSELSEIGISISNIVATIELDTKLDLYSLYKNFDNSSYEPESNSALIYRPIEDSSVTCMIPSSARVTIVGGKNRYEIESGIKNLINELQTTEYDVKKSPDEAVVRNIVAVGKIEQKIDLSELTIYLGLDQTEFDPDNFPGLIYRSGNHTIMMFRSGKYVITGLVDYENALHAALDFIDELPDEVATI
jgi:transcription initiation factor TFIID TATA-box-binding protein